MRFKKFESDQKWFQIMIPLDWEEYEDEEGSYAFFNSDNWKGNFRITPLKFDSPDSFGNERTYSFIQAEIDENPGSCKIRLGEYECVHYKNYVENERSVIYFWVFIKIDHIFTCSFTTDSDKEFLAEIISEIQLAEKSIASIKIN